MEMNKNMHPPYATFDDFLELAIQTSYNAHSTPTIEQFQASWKQMDSLLQKKKETDAN
jgi:hypothetical protein